MATRVGVVAAVAGAAVVALLSAALALYGQPLDTGTRPRAAFPDGRRRDGAGAAGTRVVFATRARPRRQAAGGGGCRLGLASDNANTAADDASWAALARSFQDSLGAGRGDVIVKEF